MKKAVRYPVSYRDLKIHSLNQSFTFCSMFFHAWIDLIGFFRSPQKIPLASSNEMSHLVRLYAGNVLTNDTILKAGDYLKQLDLGKSSQLSDENLGIGDSTWAVLAEIEEEHDTKPLFSSVRNYYLATIKNC